jgi:hypothetical protein
MKTEIRNVTSLTVDEINECCPVCRSKLFGDRPPSDLSTAAIKNWLLSLKELESSNQELRFVLWEYGEGCGPLAGVSIRRSETDAEKASLAGHYSEPSLFSGLATATCQFAISHAFKSGFTKHITAHVDASDYLSRKLFSTIPLTPPGEAICMDCLASHGVSYMIRIDDSDWSTWDFERVLSRAKSRIQSGREMVDWSEDLMGLSGSLRNRVAA